MGDVVCPACGYGQPLDGLRAQVEALPPAGFTPYWVSRAAVLALFDGGGE